MSKLAIALTTTVALTSSARRLVRHLAAHAVGLGSPAEGAVQRAQGQAAALTGIKANLINDAPPKFNSHQCATKDTIRR
jgi:hypothetical protein